MLTASISSLLYSPIADSRRTSRLVRVVRHFPGSRSLPDVGRRLGNRQFRQAIAHAAIHSLPPPQRCRRLPPGWRCAVSRPRPAHSVAALLQLQVGKYLASERQSILLAVVAKEFLRFLLNIGSGLCGRDPRAAFAIGFANHSCQFTQVFV